MPALALILGLFLLLTGCTQPPEIPRLKQAEPHPVEKVAFDNDFGPEDLRALFRALNADGRLDSLKPYLEEPSDDALSAWTEWFGENALNQGGVSAFLPLLEQRVEGGGFARWREWMGRWKKDASFFPEREVGFSLLQQTGFSRWLTTSVPLLNPDFLGALERIRPLGKTGYAEVVELPAIASVTGDEAKKDLETFLKDETLQKDFQTEFSFFFEKDFSNAILRTLTSMKGSALFEGFGTGLRRMVLLRPEPPEIRWEFANQLDLLLNFAKSANQDSNGLFSAVQEQLTTNKLLIKILNEKLQRRIDNVLAATMEKRLRSPQFDQEFWLGVTTEAAGPSNNFNLLVEALVSSLEEFVPLKVTPQEQEKFPKVLPLYLNSLVIAKWFERKVAEHRAELTALPKEKFVEAFWAGSFHPEEMTVELTDLAATDVRVPKLAGFFKDFDAYIAGKIEPVKNFEYKIRKLDPEVSLRNALLRVMADLNRTRPFLEAGPILRSLVYYFSNPESGSFFLLSNFETDNLMDALNVWISGSPLDFLRRVKNKLFNDFGIAQLEPGDRNLILSLLEKRPALQTMVGELLDAVQSVGEFDTPAAPTLPTAFEFYRELTAKVGASDLPWVAHLLSFMARANFFAETEDGEKYNPVYPSLYKTIQGRTLSRWLHTMSFLTRTERYRFQEVFDGLLGPGERGLGWEDQRQALLALLEKQPEGVKFVLDRLMNKGWDLVPDFNLLSYGERSSFTRWVTAGKHEKLAEFFRNHGGRQTAHESALTLQKLTETGEIRRAFQLLTRVQHASLRKLAQILLTAEANGEWQALLDFWLDLSASQ